ncbi:MAG: methyl-accepting chemotaxis protein [Gammaproteobacteria bacterium]|nr:methyl-accepting chemotaxis protein [Gammaproteobacteria bacterium]
MKTPLTGRPAVTGTVGTLAARLGRLISLPSTIRSRLLWLIGLQAMILMLIGGGSLAIVNAFVEREATSSAQVMLSDRISQINETLRVEVIDPVYALHLGSIDWTEAQLAFERGRRQLDRLWGSFNKDITGRDAKLVQSNVSPFKKDIDELFDRLGPVLESKDTAALTALANQDLQRLAEPFMHAMVGLVAYKNHRLAQQATDARVDNERFLVMTGAGVLIGLLLAVTLGALIYRSISRPVGTVAQTLARLSQGDLDARSGLSAGDEISRLGVALDNLLDERVAQMTEAQRENEALNNAVVNLLKAVYQLSQRDLTIKVPVTEDVTGPIADSLNLLTEETAKVLGGVVHISERVKTASNAVKRQSDSAIQASDVEQEQVELAATELSNSAEAMLRIARLAHACSQAADNAIKSTELAQDTVLESVSGITGIRDTIRETEKRLKRLGERSQEISGVVNLINSIAERTHILALNASMHAASAGEAGRGFAVVADEVQRLAENSREATSQIASLVNNIQVETADTAVTMNETISKVVEGTRLAERAGVQMQATNKTTSDLVAMVLQIAKQSRDHARASAELRTRARDIIQSASEANARLKAQTELTDRLEVYSERLLEAVSVFTLPAQRLDDRLSDSLVIEGPGTASDSAVDATVTLFPEHRKQIMAG